MNYNLIVLFSFSIFIAALIGWIRFKRINPTYYPFIFCLWVGLLNEIVSFLIAQAGYQTAVNNNIYVLIESIMFAWQFKRWGIFNQHKNVFGIIITIFAITWVLENIIIWEITMINSYFRIFYSFLLVLMSVGTINNLLFRESDNLLKNPVFLICIGFIIYFTYKVLVEAFWIYGLNSSENFRMRVYDISSYINLFTNLVYALAVLWMPQKQKFSLPF
jgi:hypothetical protein